MKLQLGEIREMVTAMPILLQEKLLVKTAYHLARTFRELSSHMKDMDSARNGLLEKYGKKDEKGKVIIKENQYEIEDTESFSKEYSELAQQEVEVDFEGFSLEDFRVDSTEKYRQVLSRVLGQVKQVTSENIDKTVDMILSGLEEAGLKHDSELKISGLDMAKMGRLIKIKDEEEEADKK